MKKYGYYILGIIMTCSTIHGTKNDPQNIIIQKVINSFAGKSNDFIPQKTTINGVSFIEVNDKNNNTNQYFGIHEKDQTTVDYKQLKKHIIEQMHISKSPKILEIVGDSNTFSKEGTIFASENLKKFQEPLGIKTIFEYGYTGHAEGEKVDVNGLINEFANNNNTKAHAILANIVGHSYTALTDWKCTASPYIRFFTVIYNNAGMTNETFTKFGDDVQTTEALCDGMVCLEGGIQSFRQVVTILDKGLPILFIGNIREEKDKVFFGTATFLHRIKKISKSNKNLSPNDVLNIYKKYEETLKNPWDQNRPDHKTKKKLFETALADFIKKDLYKKVISNQCFFAMMP